MTSCIQNLIKVESFARNRRQLLQEEEVALAVLRLFTVPALHRLSCLQAVPGVPVSEFDSRLVDGGFQILHCYTFKELNDENSPLTKYHKPQQLLSIHNLGSFLGGVSSSNQLKSSTFQGEICVLRHRVLHNILVDPESSRVRCEATF